MDIVKIILVAITGVFAVVILREVKPELSLFAGIAAGIILLMLIAADLIDVVDAFGGIAENASLDSSVFKAIIKIVGVGYLTEYSAGICEDYGSNSIGKKVQLAGKVSIFALAVPILISVVEAISEVLK